MIPLEQLQLRIANLELRMLEKSPEYKTELENIRQILQRDPELVHLLKDDTELHTIFAAMQMYKQIEIPITVQKSDKAKLIPKKLGLDDF